MSSKVFRALAFVLIAMLLASVGFRTASAVGAVIGIAAAGLIFLSGWGLDRFGTREFMWGSVGAGGGLVLALLLDRVFAVLWPIDHYRPEVVTALTLGFAYLGIVAIGLRGRREPSVSRSGNPRMNGARPAKLLDTSVIIDGRIADICGTHFLDGPLVVPRFVLKELQLIADSSDPLRRARGRRGLDMLKRMQQEEEHLIEIDDAEIPEVEDVDSKLVRLAQARHARIVTNDLNLNKVAQLEGVIVLNVNDLANALKPVVLPGEEMTVRLLKRGKEADQGVGYLEDGTMVVVEGASDLIGQTVGAAVTSVLQTAAGRMIFCRMKE